MSALTELPERSIRLAIAALVPAVAAAGMAAALSREGTHSPVRLAAVALIFATTVPVGILVLRTHLSRIWVARPSRRALLATIGFVVYADIGVTAVLFTFTSHELAMFGTVLYAVIGAYVGHFTSRRVVIAHVTFTSVVITVLALLTWKQGRYDAVGVIARWLTLMLTVNCTVGVVNIFNSAIQRAVRTQLENALLDPLTGLLNRRGLDFAAERKLTIATGHSVGFLLVDLDHFKAVNDTHGHSVGDAVLITAATRLRQAAGADTTIARTGGEEFAVVLHATQARAGAVADRILTALHDPGDDVPITVSIGGAVLAADHAARDDPGPALSEGLRRADQALYQAKSSGRNTVRMFSQHEPGAATGVSRR